MCLVKRKNRTCQKTKAGIKTTIWIFQETNWREVMDKAIEESLLIAAQNVRRTN